MAEEERGSREVVLRIWEETTGIRLNPEQRIKFLSRPKVAALRRIPTDNVIMAFTETPKLSAALDLARQRRNWSRGMTRVPGLRKVSRSRRTNLERPNPEPTESGVGTRSRLFVGSFGQQIYVEGVCPSWLHVNEDCFCE